MRRILVVEDEQPLREAYNMILSSGPYQVDTAVNGHAALELCRANQYDLILLDLMMPEVDGVGFLQRFTVDKKLPSKVVILSNLSAGQELETAMALGAHRSIVKAELSPRELMAAVRYEVEA